METQEQIERIEHFIREVIVDEITKLQGVGLSYMQFVIMGQAIEVLGSFLDNKPSHGLIPVLFPVFLLG